MGKSGKMIVANIHDTKSNLSRYLKEVAAGEEVIICSYGNPVAKIVPYTNKIKCRKPGLLKGKIKIAADFDELPEDFLKYFR